MQNKNEVGHEEIFSKVLRAGRRTYFFDVRETKAGDYYLTLTESKKFLNDDGTFFYKKHKVYLYKEDFNEFKSFLEETTNFIIDKKGEEVISEIHQKDFDSSKKTDSVPSRLFNEDEVEDIEEEEEEEKKEIKKRPKKEAEKKTKKETKKKVKKETEKKAKKEKK
ncbi:MAG: DNA-binding protein [Flavobacteriaceae bacterium]|nr:DNA-binding protein [Flavobacteriaceae bacterium]